MAAQWAYGITVSPKRITTYLPATVDSLALGGFDLPSLFVDGPQLPNVGSLGRLTTYRMHPIKAYGNWLLSLMELWIRHPKAKMFALFQDDISVCRRLKEYLTVCNYPENGYLNLYTAPQNEVFLKEREVGWYPSNQMGKGALGLVFSQRVAQILLGSAHMLVHHRNGSNGTKCIDGTVLTACKQAGITEYVHVPSLVQHTGTISAVGNSLKKMSQNFPGEQYNAMEFLND